MTDGDKLRLLADWFDKCYTGPSRSEEVQCDLRRLAAQLDTMRSPAQRATNKPTTPCRHLKHQHYVGGNNLWKLRCLDCGGIITL